MFTQTKIYYDVSISQIGIFLHFTHKPISKVSIFEQCRYNEP